MIESDTRSWKASAPDHIHDGLFFFFFFFLAAELGDDEVCIVRIVT